jgi:hypothetical protein
MAAAIAAGPNAVEDSDLDADKIVGIGRVSILESAA